jgi:hypothetical protein
MHVATWARARLVARAMNRVIKAHGEEPDTPDQTEAIENLYRVIGARPDPSPDQ